MAKRGAQGNGSIRKRSDGRWEARYTVGRDPKTGKQIQKSVYGNSQNDVLKKLQKVCVEISDGIYAEPSKMTVEEWNNIWLDQYNNNVKEFTYKSYETHLRIHINPELGNVKLANLTAPDIQKFYNQLTKGSETTKPLSAKTVKNIHGIIHKSLRQAVLLGYIKNNPSEVVNLPRVEKPKIKPLVDDNVVLFLNAIKGHKYENVFIVTLFTGMRQGEILGLTWDCVDFEKGVIIVEKQLIREKKKNGIYKFAPLKNDQTRTIIAAPSILDLLKEIKQTDDYKRNKFEEWNSEKFVFTDQSGIHLKHMTVFSNFKAVVRKLGLPDIRFHDLRHSYAVISLENGDSIKSVQENLGHATASFTLSTYAHVSETMKKDSAERMDKYFKNAKNCKGSE